MGEEAVSHLYNIARNGIDDKIVDDPNFDRKLDLVTEGATPFIKNHLLERISRENCATIVDYILAMHTEINLSDRWRYLLVYFFSYVLLFPFICSYLELLGLSVKF
jgi:hypothetical protein